MRLRSRGRDENRSTLDALYRRVHPPVREVDVDEAVRRELRRGRERRAEERRLAELRQFVGGPCWLCGVTSARRVEDGREFPDWHPHPRGVEDGWCVEWRWGGDDDYLLDKVATVLRDGGLAAVQQPKRLYSRIEPGLAAKLGVRPWCDSGAEPGERWGHLAPIAERLDRERATAAPTSQPQSITLTELLDRNVPGSEPRWDYGVPAEHIARMDGQPRPVNEAELARLEKRRRREIERSNRRRRT